MGQGEAQLAPGCMKEERRPENKTLPICSLGHCANWPLSQRITLPLNEVKHSRGPSAALMGFQELVNGVQISQVLGSLVTVTPKPKLQRQRED